MSNPEEENKNHGDQETQIILKVKAVQEEDEVLYRIKKSTQLKKLMYAYCDRRAVKLDAFAFIFDGRRIRREQTPNELNMKDEDVIDVCRSMGGGLRINQLQWYYMVFDKIKCEFDDLL